MHKPILATKMIDGLLRFIPFKNTSREIRGAHGAGGDGPPRSPQPGRLAAGRQWSKFGGSVLGWINDIVLRYFLRSTVYLPQLDEIGLFVRS